MVGARPGRPPARAARHRRRHRGARTPWSQPPGAHRTPGRRPDRRHRQRPVRAGDRSGQETGAATTAAPAHREAVFGLAAGIRTTNHDRATRAVRALRTGIVWVHTHGTTVSETPHGGVDQSGYGSDLSLTGLLDHTHPKRVML
ncbi:aldehyde dehydrogenase family protein [Streptomyces sp. NPDC006197]|uniref:aldehyde dehydrogenase family protein n=1 Tax=Streptomyces sp. NPDC006197 TaxID=3156685 RepID=UPI0033B1A06E